MKKYKINKSFITQKMGDKLTIFDSEKSVFFTFNETAGFIFNKLIIGWEVNKIIENLIKRYGINKQKAKKDVISLIRELGENKIINAY